jgi:hypothetical protein
MDPATLAYIETPAKKRGRKRKEIDETEKIIMQEQRRQKNKASASESRNRRKHFISSLEADKERLESEKRQLEAEILRLESRISALDKSDCDEIAIDSFRFGEDDSNNLFSASALLQPNLLSGVEEDSERLFDAIFPVLSPSDVLLGNNYSNPWLWNEEDVWLA